MTLEEQLAAACERGLTHLTLYPIPSADNKTTYWAARATPSTGHHYVAAEAQEPVQALLDVLKQMPKAPKRNAPKVTATVTEPPGGHGTDGPPGVDLTPQPKPETMEDWLPKVGPRP